MTRGLPHGPYRDERGSGCRNPVATRWAAWLCGTARRDREREGGRKGDVIIARLCVGYTHTHTHTHTHRLHTHARTRARTHTHIHSHTKGPGKHMKQRKHRKDLARRQSLDLIPNGTWRETRIVRKAKPSEENACAMLRQEGSMHGRVLQRENI